MDEIRITWEGPYNLADLGYNKEDEKYDTSSKLDDQKKDYGIYQVYGFHPIYGDNVLLYIGQAKNQTFAKRLSQEWWEYNADCNNIQFYVGRLFGDKQPTAKKWNELIDIAEKMLIYAHAPAMNSSNILNISRDTEILKKYSNIRIFNYDQYRSLFPEVSGELLIKVHDFNGVFSRDK